MREIQNVAVLGAGAMGAYFAASFFDTPGFKTVLLAKGERLQKLNKEGLVINGKPYFIPAVDPDDAPFSADLIIVGVKHQHLSAAIPDLKKWVGPETTILSILNGLESEEMIGAVYGMDKLLYTISLGIDAVRLGNQITFTKPGKHVFGEAKNLLITPKVKRVQDAFTKAGITFETPPDMTRMLWWKFMINVGVNQASAVTGMPYGTFQTDSEAQGLMEGLMREVIALAAAAQVDLTAEDLTGWYPIMNTLSAQGKTSMLQDVEAKRKTEVDIFGGKVVELGKKYNIPTPVNETVTQIIRVLEKNFA